MSNFELPPYRLHGYNLEEDMEKAYPDAKYATQNNAKDNNPDNSGNLDGTYDGEPLTIGANDTCGCSDSGNVRVLQKINMKQPIKNAGAKVKKTKKTGGSSSGTKSKSKNSRSRSRSKSRSRSRSKSKSKSESKSKNK